MENGFIELAQIVGRRSISEEQAAHNRAAAKAAQAAGRRITAKPLRPRPAVPALLPISKSSWWAGVAAGKYPRPVKAGRRTLWRSSDIAALLERLGAQ
jgi:prophage regulatory protein